MEEGDEVTDAWPPMVGVWDDDSDGSADGADAAATLPAARATDDAVVGVPAVGLRALLLTLAEHHSELLQIDDLDEQDASFLASVACWQVLLEVDRGAVVDMLGALHAFGCDDIAELIVDAIGMRADHDFGLLLQRARARHRSRLMHPSAGDAAGRLRPGRAPLAPSPALREAPRLRVAHNN